MVPFREAYPMIIFLVLDVLAGNTAFVSPWHPFFAESHLTQWRVAYLVSIARAHLAECKSSLSLMWSALGS